MIYAGTNSVVYASTNNFATGLTGTIGVQIIDATGAAVRARTTSGIAEAVSGSGFYVATIDLSAVSPTLNPGHYFVFWDNGSVAPGNNASEDLIVHVTTPLAAVMRALGAAQASHNAEQVQVAVIVG